MHLGGAEHYRPAAERAQLTGVSYSKTILPTQPAGQVDVSVRRVTDGRRPRSTGYTTMGRLGQNTGLR